MPIKNRLKRIIRQTTHGSTGRQLVSGVLLVTVAVVVLVLGIRLTSQSHAATLLKVMPMGDSITDNSGAYRTTLWTRLVTQEHYSFDFVGSLSSGPAELGDKNHEGHNGWVIEDLRMYADSWMSTYQPDVVLLIAGSNDAEQNRNLATAPARLLDLVNRICTDRPGIGVIVSTLPPEVGEPVDIPAFNSKVPGVVASARASGCNAVLVDSFTGMTASDLMSDGIHPNTSGNIKIGNVFYPALKAFLTGAPSDTVAPTTAVTAPAANATVSGTSTITATASDAVGVARVDLLVDGAVKGSDTASPYSYAWNTTSLTNGSHSIQSKAYDAAGNVGTSPSVAVTVNNIVTPPPGISLTVTATFASSGDATNTPANTRDSNLDTYWAGCGNGQWIQYDLGIAQSVSGVGIAFHLGDSRTAMFDVALSTNGTAWTTVLTNQQSKLTTALQYSSFAATSARYVRIIGHGNSDPVAATACWNSYSEVEVRGTVTLPTPTPTPTPPPTVIGDVNGDGRVNAIDLSTVLSHDGQNYPVADFNHDGTVGAADMAMLLARWTW